MLTGTRRLTLRQDAGGAAPARRRRKARGEPVRDAEGAASTPVSPGAEAVFPISAATGEGVAALLDAVLARLPERSTLERARGEEWSPL